MKTSKLVMGAAAVAGLAGAAAVGMGFGERPEADRSLSGTYNIDGVHSSVIFKVKHMGVSNFYGRFNEVTGTFGYDAASPESGAFDVTIKADSVDSHNAGRDAHLKKTDFFNAKEFPTITFKSTSIKKSGDKLELTGDMTLLGKTKPVTATLVQTGEKSTPQGDRAGVEATFTIKRSDFGMTFMVDNGGLGDEVSVIVALEGVAKK